MIDLQPCGPSDRPLPEVSRSIPVSLQLGTGASIYTSTLIPAILSAKHEIILVTCFLAPSKTLSAIRDAFETLATKRSSLLRQGNSLPSLRISICFSSRSLLQKLLHTSSPDGYLYPPPSWPKKLGLPSQAVLEAGGINLSVKSLFFLPFSVMHPKFVIIDRRRALLPSCNISWEVWLEGCVEIRGDALADLLAFYSRTWDKSLDIRVRFPPALEGVTIGASAPGAEANAVATGAHYLHVFPPGQTDIATLVLPSPHCRNPHFRPFPWQANPPVPPSPLNIAVLRLFDRATDNIYMQTPNLTCALVISALLAALQRGVHVTIVTSRNMMMLEQLVTAGTTTSWSIHSMIRQYKSMYSASATHAQPRPPSQRQVGNEAPGALDSGTDLESQHPHPGKLSISYFHSHRGGGLSGRQARADLETHAVDAVEEPVHSHLKLTITDARYTVLGSGNMDRASWYTSQELGILFDNTDFAATARGAVDQVLDGRLELVFSS